MPAQCSGCGRPAPCVSVEGLHCAGWSVGGPFNAMGWKCPACRGDELFNLIIEKAMAVRAKVMCESIEGNAVSFHTVYETDEQKGADPENVRFTKATPWGNIKLGIDNPAALNQFEVGKSYYVDFTPAG